MACVLRHVWCMTIADCERNYADCLRWAMWATQAQTKAAYLGLADVWRDAAAARRLAASSTSAARTSVPDGAVRS